MSVKKWGSFVSDQKKIEHYFKEYVFGFMKTDIKREIDLARLKKPSGNFLCALGLLCYTEAMGFIIMGESMIHKMRRAAAITSSPNKRSRLTFATRVSF